MLYLIATPIGNLEDMTLRGIRMLKEADLVVSEDTRKTGFLLKHFDIHKPQISFREDNEPRVLPKIMAALKNDETVAMVTDAGSPSISDPGFTLVRAAIENNIPISAIPGPTAAIAALSLSGLPVHSFTFRGFPPRKSGARKRFFEIDKESPHTLIFYESPHRLVASLQDALEVYGDREAVIANDLTKKFETVVRDRISGLLEFLKEKPPLGEYTFLIMGANPRKPSDGRVQEDSHATESGDF